MTMYASGSRMKYCLRARACGCLASVTGLGAAAPCLAGAWLLLRATWRLVSRTACRASMGAAERCHFGGGLDRLRASWRRCPLYLARFGFGILACPSSSEPSGG